MKIHTNAGVVGLGEPIVEGRAQTCAAAVKEIEPYLVGKDPRAVVHHWQAIYRHAFYRGGPVLTSALSGIDQALWDIKGKLLGVPVYELLGGPTRQRIRVYAHAGIPLSRASLDRMLQWDRDNAMHKHGEFKYSIEELGLDEGVIRVRMADYFELLDNLAREAA